MEEISQSQKERLAHIDFRLYFLGAVGRNDLVNRFGIKAAAATRDLALYRELASQNIEYDTKAKVYKVSAEFKPLFEYKADRVLAALSKGIGDENVAAQQAYILSETPSQLSKPDLNVLSVLSRAIYSHKIVHIEYRSLSSGFTSREIVPFALVDNGLRWHVRAYDRRRERFTDFVLTRITNPELLSDSELHDHELVGADKQWNRIVELELVAHPKLTHKETIELDYGMQEGVLNIDIRAAIAGYLLRRWNVDCTADADLDGAEFHLWLRNKLALYGVENLNIAPGYLSEDDSRF